MEIVRLVGMEGLSNEEKLTLEIARSIREDYLFQNAFDKEDAFSSPKKQYGMIKSIITAYEAGRDVVTQEDFDFERFRELASVKDLGRVKDMKEDEFAAFQQRLIDEISSLRQNSAN
jgi:V/A-type H+-transporting ATPase subunit A